MKIGFVKPKFIGETRVPLFPHQISVFHDTVYVEKGFGLSMNITDEAYEENGAIIVEREQIFNLCDSVFSLKVLHPSDYHLIKEGLIVIGWTHPTGSGVDFMKQQALPKDLVIVDIANNLPLIHYRNAKYEIPWLQPNFNYKNAVTAGYASVYHALISHNIIIDPNWKVAVLGSGNVSQGAFSLLSKLGADVRMFYRRTLTAFNESIGDFDIVVNGIEISEDDAPIISFKDQENIKTGCLIIDAAADAGYAIEGTKYTSIENPIYYENGKYYYVVNNSPSLFYRHISRIISHSFAEHVYSRSLTEYLSIIGK